MGGRKQVNDARNSLFISVLASVVLVLAVYHKQFRKVFFWVAGISVAGAGIFFLSVRLYHKHEAKRKLNGESEHAWLVFLFPISLTARDCLRLRSLLRARGILILLPPPSHSSYLANIVEIHGGRTSRITPPHNSFLRTATLTLFRLSISAITNLRAYLRQLW